jgi:hypothetical protein
MARNGSADCATKQVFLGPVPRMIGILGAWGFVRTAADPRSSPNDSRNLLSVLQGVDDDAIRQTKVFAKSGTHQGILFS